MLAAQNRSRQLASIVKVLVLTRLEAIGLSDREASEGLGLNPSAVGRYRRDEREMPIWVLVGLAELSRTSLEDLVSQAQELRHKATEATYRRTETENSALRAIARQFGVPLSKMLDL